METKITKTTEYNEGNIGEVYCSPIDSEHIVEYDNGIMYADNEILIVTEDGTSYATVENLAKEYNAEIVGWIEQTGDYQLKFSTTYTKDEIDNIASKIESKSYIESAYVNYISEVSTDSINYGSEWSGETWSEEEHAGSNWNLEAIHCLSAWNLLEENTIQENAIKIGLYDVGFDSKSVQQKDLNFSEVIYNNDDFLTVYNKLPSGETKDTFSHGTHVAGTMAAISDNQEGICGVYPYGNGNLYAVSTLGTDSYSENGEFKQSIMQSKIAYAELILRNVKVINTSLGFNWYLNFENNGKYDYNAELNFYNTNDWTTLKKEAYYLGDMLKRLYNKGYDFVLVTSAGNNSNSTIGHMESEYNNWLALIQEKDFKDIYDRIIVVGAIAENSTSNKKEYSNILYDGTLSVGFGDSGYKISDFSDLGNRVDVLAPGEKIFSLWLDSSSNYGTTGYYCNYSDGTSMASPHVAGVAAMVWTANNTLKGDDVKKIICDTSNELWSMGKIGDEVIKSGYKLVDAYKAILKAIGEEVTDTQNNTSENGGILSWVVDINDNDIFIPDAKIIATNVATGEIESETTTDSDGHFELILPEGTYILTVTAIDYKEYTSTEIEIKNESVNYLDDWIKLIPKNSLIENVINNESTWIANLEVENNSIYNASGDDYIWFQDMDMDGILEFVVMSKYQEDLDLGHDYRYFTVYECDTENFEYYPQANCDLVSTATFGIDKGDLKSDTFNYSLWQKNDGSYIYLTTDSVDVMLGKLEYLKLEKGGSVNFPIIEIWDEDYPYKGCNINWTSFESNDFSDNVSYSDAIQYYNNYFSDLIPYNTVTKMIKVSDYKNKTNSEKEELLKSSYDAWDYSKSNSMELPLKEVIDYISNQVELEKQVDYKEVYKSVIEKLSGYSNKTSINYTLFDMNDDNIPELITISGTCEADYILTFYSIINGVAVIVGDDFSGFHASFYIDTDKNQFCTHWGQNGVGGIEWYSFDGKTVTISKSQENIEYALNEYSNDDFSNYGNFIQCDTEILWCSFFDNTWTSWLYTSNNSSGIEYQGKDYSLIDNYNN